MSLVVEESWIIQRPEDFGEDLSGAMDDKLRGCVPDWPIIPLDSGGCGTIAMNQAMGIGIWKGPTENDRLVEALYRELAVTMAELDPLERGGLIRHIFQGMNWSPSGREGDDPELQPFVDNLVEVLKTSGRMRQLTEEWLLAQCRGW